LRLLSSEYAVFVLQAICDSAHFANCARAISKLRSAFWLRKWCRLTNHAQHMWDRLTVLKDVLV